MNPSFSLGTFADFVQERWPDILSLTGQHLAVLVISLLIATALGVLVGVAVWNRPLPRTAALTTAGIAITVPSLALLALLSPLLGLGWGPSVVALVFYALLPIIRNTVVGLREVPPHIVESALGMGMGRGRIMITTQLPLAWPVIVTGIRVSAQLTIGIAAIAAYVAGPGLGGYIFKGLSSVGSKNAINYAVTGTLGTVLLALAVDGVFILIARYTTSRGLRG